MKFLLTATIILLITTFAVLAQRSSEPAQEVDEVVLDYETRPRSVSKEREAKNRRFDAYGDYPLRELGEKGLQLLPTTSHWWIGMGAIPVESSEAVVVGSVTKREAFLSKNEKSVYTEYEIKIEQVLKNAADKSIIPDKVIPVVRVGGTVRFGTENVQRFTMSKLGVLKNAARYLLFLRKSNGVDQFVITGYELTDGKVTPLDGGPGDDPRTRLSFHKYKGADEDTLLEDVKQAVRKVAE